MDAIGVVANPNRDKSLEKYNNTYMVGLYFIFLFPVITLLYKMKNMSEEKNTQYWFFFEEKYKNSVLFKVASSQK